MRVEYQIIYSDRKTIGLTVERDNRVVVHAPLGTTEERIQKVVESRKLWLFEKSRHVQKYPDRPQQKEFVSGEVLLYLGRHYRLEIADAYAPGVTFHSKFMISRLNQSQAQELCREWYERRARERLKSRARYFARMMGVEFNRVLVSNPQYRWGSCTPKNNLVFSWRIVKAPTYVIDYLVVHELAHLLESNHTKRFWNIVAIQVPRYEEAKSWLKENGNVLEVDF